MNQGALDWFDRAEYARTKNFKPGDWLEQLEKRQMLNWELEIHNSREGDQDTSRALVGGLMTTPLDPDRSGREFYCRPSDHPELHCGAVFSPNASMLSDLADKGDGKDSFALAPTPANVQWNSMLKPLVPCMVDLSQPPAMMDQSFRQWRETAQRVYDVRGKPHQNFKHALDGHYRQWGILEFFDITIWLAVFHPGRDITDIGLGQLGRAADRAGNPDIPRWARYMYYLIFGTLEGNIDHWRKNIRDYVKTYTSWHYVGDLSAYVRNREDAPR